MTNETRNEDDKPCLMGRTDYEACFAPFRYCSVKGCGRTENHVSTTATPLSAEETKPDLDELLDHHARGYLYAAKPLANLVPALIAERDQARNIAVALEQQASEALRITKEALDIPEVQNGMGYATTMARDALEDIVSVLGASDD